VTLKNSEPHCISPYPHFHCLISEQLSSVCLPYFYVNVLNDLRLLVCSGRSTTVMELFCVKSCVSL